MHTVKEFQSLLITVLVLKRLLYKSLCCGQLFELPREVEAIQMSINNIAFIKKIRKENIA